MKACHCTVASLQFLHFFSIGVLNASPIAQECHKDIEVLWSTQAGSSSIVSSPMIVDINGDNVKDVLVTSFGGEVIAVDGETGRFLSGWPVTFTDQTFHAAPLLVGCFKLAKLLGKISQIIKNPLIYILQYVNYYIIILKQSLHF